MVDVIGKVAEKEAKKCLIKCLYMEVIHILTAISDRILRPLLRDGLQQLAATLVDEGICVNKFSP